MYFRKSIFRSQLSPAAASTRNALYRENFAKRNSYWKRQIEKEKERLRNANLEKQAFEKELREAQRSKSVFVPTCQLATKANDSFKAPVYSLPISPLGCFAHSFVARNKNLPNIHPSLFLEQLSYHWNLLPDHQRKAFEREAARNSEKNKLRTKKRVSPCQRFVDEQCSGMRELSIPLTNEEMCHIAKEEWRRSRRISKSIC